ncbi:hypothetical protein SSBR45G_08120 [Bradyrhizobium sp. SSBR45G]|nr:hypothetical protein SSBR45G_08120 [Bradyrhizobium sp. SSBR45G]GLH85141.1 hypothetical protein SSBR45R_26010 [Bradyrhizobium sp. SSBR45R]
MVESPIEPVAPSTVMLRTSAAPALLFRNGTALMFSPKISTGESRRSPNQKSAADPVEAAAQQTEDRGDDDCRDIAVQAVQ